MKPKDVTALRERLGLTHAELAHALGISQATAYRMEAKGAVGATGASATLLETIRRAADEVTPDKLRIAIARGLSDVYFRGLISTKES